MQNSQKQILTNKQLNMTQQVSFPEENELGISKNDQTLKGLTDQNKLELRRKLQSIQQGKYELKPTTKALEIKDNTISWKYVSQWCEYDILLVFEDIADLKTYQLVKYYYKYNYSSNPPFVPQPAVEEGKLSDALKAMDNNI